MNIIAAVVQLISKLPPEGLAAFGKLVKALFTSRDPLRAVKRAAAAVASENASDEILRRRLGTRKKST